MTSTCLVHEGLSEHQPPAWPSLDTRPSGWVLGSLAPGRTLHVIAPCLSALLSVCFPAVLGSSGRAGMPKLVIVIKIRSLRLPVSYAPQNRDLTNLCVRLTHDFTKSGPFPRLVQPLPHAEARSWSAWTLPRRHFEKTRCYHQSLCLSVFLVLAWTLFFSYQKDFKQHGQLGDRGPPTCAVRFTRPSPVLRCQLLAPAPRVSGSCASP